MLNKKECPLCKRELFSFEPCYKEVGCGHVDCPGYPMYTALWIKAQQEYNKMMAKKYPGVFLDLEGIENYKDAKEKL